MLCALLGLRVCSVVKNEPGKFERIGLARFLAGDAGDARTIEKSIEGENLIEYSENGTGSLTDVLTDCSTVIIV